MSVTAWDDLVAVAVQGTARRPPDVAAWLAELGEDAAVLGGEPPERLLDAAALATAARRAGRMPVVGTEPPAPAPPERLPVAPSLGPWVAELAGEPALLGALLRDMRAGSLVLPAERVAATLEIAAAHPALAEDAVAACGERGRWLAPQHPSWASLLERVEGASADPVEAAPDSHPCAATPLDDSPWRTGSPARRIGWLRLLRAREPQRAAALVDVAMHQTRGEKADVREEIVRLLGDDPRPALAGDDERVLEAALGDRAKGVRRAAAHALQRAGHPAYTGRMIARARSWVRLHEERRVLGRTARSLGIEVPGELDETSSRDLARPATPTRDQPREAWLGQVVSATPLAAWRDLGTPDEVLGLPVDPRWQSALVAGLVTRADAEGDRPWADALLRAHPYLPDGFRLAGVASPEPVAEIVLGLLERLGNPAAAQAAQVWLTTLPQPWPTALLDGFLEQLPALSRAGHPAPWHGVLERVADTAPTAAVHLLERVAPECTPGWGPALARVAHRLHLRARLARALDEAHDAAYPQPTPPTPEPTGGLP